ncbi:MAG: helix-turn-helix domain-containing protein [Clostridiales bacterium]|nr:helix-turn-helix domain-containing protein [Clostridiales bacterium]
MDQVKTGQFIKACRKEKALTQREVAEKLNISEKTISKWETGNGLPEVGLMLPLCELLEISVNELLSGERLDEKKYFEKAEQNIMSLIQEKAEAKKKLIIAFIAGFAMLAAGLTIILLAGLLEMQTWLKIVLMIVGFVIICIGVGIACVLERDAGTYECKHCGERFVPTMKAYLFAPHMPTSRKLKCPKCGKKSYCKKRLSKTEE